MTEKTQPQKEEKQEKGVLAAKEEHWGAGRKGQAEVWCCPALK